MKTLVNSFAITAAVSIALMASTCGANATGPQRDPTVVISELADRIYAAGETTGNVADMVTAEAKAADEIRQYVANGLTAGLLAQGKGQQSPLETAAYMGYPNVVAALLTSNLVRAHINDADEMGLTPWIAASFSMKQSLWVCNPAVFTDPYKFVPMFVTQPYYKAKPTPPYWKTRQELEDAGASTDLAKAKEIWLANCTGASNEARDKVQSTTDLQKTVQELADADLAAQLIRLQRNASDSRGK